MNIEFIKYLNIGSYIVLEFLITFCGMILLDIQKHSYQNSHGEDMKLFFLYEMLGTSFVLLMALTAISIKIIELMSQ